MLDPWIIEEIRRREEEERQHREERPVLAAALLAKVEIETNGFGVESFYTSDRRHFLPS